LVRLPGLLIVQLPGLLIGSITRVIEYKCAAKKRFIEISFFQHFFFKSKVFYSYERLLHDIFMDIPNSWLITILYKIRICMF